MAYTAPRLNIPVIWIFLDRGICNCHSIGIGRVTTRASMSKLVIPASKYARFAFAHSPEIVLFQL